MPDALHTRTAATQVENVVATCATPVCHPTTPQLSMALQHPRPMPIPTLYLCIAPYPARALSQPHPSRALRHPCPSQPCPCAWCCSLLGPLPIPVPPIYSSAPPMPNTALSLCMLPRPATALAHPSPVCLWGHSTRAHPSPVIARCHIPLGSLPIPEPSVYGTAAPVPILSQSLHGTMSR